MKIHYFQHAPFEGLGIIEDWIKRPGNSITATKFYEDQKLPFVDLFEVLIVMGGPMSIYDEKQYSWLNSEKKLIEKAIAANKKVLGICLGAQLIADVLGAKVYKNQEKEIGWMPVEYIADRPATPLFSSVPKKHVTFHWHGDTFDLPEGATRFASSEGCLNQGFFLNENVLAIQYHMEVTKPLVRMYVEEGMEELVNGKYIQKGDVIINQEDTLYENNHEYLNEIFHKFIKN